MNWHGRRRFALAQVAPWSGRRLDAKPPPKRGPFASFAPDPAIPHANRRRRFPPIMPERYWEVVREEAFEEELLFLIPDAHQADDFVEGAEYILPATQGLDVSLGASRSYGLCRWPRFAASKFPCSTRSTI